MFYGWFISVLCVINCNNLIVALWDVCLYIGLNGDGMGGVWVRSQIVLWKGFGWV